MKHVFFFTVLFLFAIQGLFSLDDALVNQFWADNQFDELEQYLTLEIQTNNDERAYVHLFLLYDLLHEEDAALDILIEGMEHFSTSFPYLLTMTIQSVFMEKFNDGDKKAIGFFEALQNSTENNGRLSAKVTDILIQNYFLNRNEKKANANIDGLGLITDWSLIGPFDNISASGYQKNYPPENEHNPEAIYTGKNNIPIHWLNGEFVRNTGWIEITDFIPFYHSVNYANTYIYSSSKRKAQLRLGTSGAFKIYLNDEIVMEYEKETNNGLDTFVVETELQEGWNRLLLKLCYSEISKCNFAMRLTDELGKPLSGFEFSTEPQDYPKLPNAETKIIPDLAELYFQEKIASHPEQWENYLLLSNFYFNDDRDEEAEITIQKLCRLFPKSVLLKTFLLKAYTQNDKTDFTKMVIDEIDAITDKINLVNVAKALQYLQSEEYDKALNYIQNYKVLFGEDETYYDLIIQYYARKEMVNELLQTIEDAYKKYPYNYQLMKIKAILSIEMEKNYAKAITYYKKYTKKFNSYTALSNLASFYLQEQQLVAWESSHKSMNKIYPTYIEPYYQMAEGLFGLKNYTHALEKVQKAIEIAPFHDKYWEFAGKCYDMLGQKKQAAEMYEKAILYDNLNYSARDLLRELQQKEPIFQIFEPENIDSLLAHSPTRADYPSDDAIIVWSEKNNVVYPNSGFRSHNELLIRILNKTGIQDFTQFSVPVSPNQDFTIEEAIAYKDDGTRIKADTNKNTAVFKQLEENDFIYIRWKTKTYQRGKLMPYFWDEHDFNSFYPCEKVKFSVLFAEQTEAPVSFQYQTNNFQLEPTRKLTEEGLIYEWTLEKEASIKPETGMPHFADIGKILYVTTIPDWQFVIDWYRELAESKSEVTYEIKEAVEKITGGNPNLSDEEKIRLVYEFITENITYSSVSFRQSGLIPQKARDVLINKIGDCKDVTTLSIAMLKELGIDAYLTLVGTTHHNSPVHFLPSIDIFDHVITRVTINNETKYFDHTAKNYPFQSVPLGDIGAYNLTIFDESQPMYLNAENFPPSNIIRKGNIEILSDKSVIVELHNMKSGYYSAQMRHVYRELDDTNRKKSLTESIGSHISNVTLIEYDMPAIDSLNYQFFYDYQYKADAYIKETGSFLFFAFPWSENISQTAALSYETRDYPIEYWISGNLNEQTFEITLPDDFEVVEMLPEKHYENNYASYSFRMRKEGKTIYVERRLEALKRKVLPEDYEMFKAFYNQIVAADETLLLLKRK
jgi:tetratricopeptide (TPR) repeat protein